MNKLFTIIIILFLLTAMPVAAEMLVIVNQENSLKKIKKTKLIDIFMKRHIHFSNGQSVIPINQESFELRQQFYKGLLNINMSQIDIYWARLSFTNRIHPPIQLKNNNEILHYVQNHRGAIAYIDSQYINTNVKVVSVETD